MKKQQWFLGSIASIVVIPIISVSCSSTDGMIKLSTNSGLGQKIVLGIFTSSGILDPKKNNASKNLDGTTLYYKWQGKKLFVIANIPKGINGNVIGTTDAHIWIDANQHVKLEIANSGGHRIINVVGLKEKNLKKLLLIAQNVK